MAIGDVERRQAAERADDGIHVGAGDLPQGVRHAIRRHKVVDRLGLRHARGHGIDGWRRRIRQEHGAGLRPQLGDVARAIVFLVAARLLVLLDEPRVVFVHRVARGQAGLLVLPHPQLVEVERRLGLLQHRLSRLREPLGRGPVDDVRIRIGAGRQVDLGARHVQEAQFVAGGQRARFLGVDDVVGDGGDARGERRLGPQRAEGSDLRHVVLAFRAAASPLWSQRRSRRTDDPACPGPVMSGPQPSARRHGT